MSKVDRTARASALVAEFIPPRLVPRTDWRGASRAAQKYERLLAQGVIPTRGDGKPKTQVRKFRVAHQRMALEQQQVREVLCSHGVVMLQFVPYFNFARHVSREKQLADSAESRYRMVSEAVDRWAAQGLQREVLVAICANVFNVTVEQGSGALPGPAV